MTAPTQLVTCPHCGAPVRGLLAICQRPDCIRRECAAEARAKRLEDR